MVSATFIIAVIIAAITIALGGAYTTGVLDQPLKKLGKLMFKAKAKAEQKKLEAEGLKEGQDFFKDELKGNQQASQVTEGLGGIGDGGLDGLKKDL